MNSISKKILILGGYGNAGKLISELLINHTDSELIIAGRNYDKAVQLANQLNYQSKERRVKGIKVDASDYESLASTSANVDIIVVASSTIVFTENIINACLNGGCDYFDIQISSKEKLRILNSYEKRIKESGRIFITDGGFHPGVPAALIRYAKSKFDELITANVGSIFRIDWKELDFSEATIRELIEEFKEFDTSVFKDGRWIELKWNEYREFDFGKIFGIQKCIPMMMEEIGGVTLEIPGIRETGFYVAGFNKVVDYIITPVLMVVLKLGQGKFINAMSKLFTWGLRKFSKPPYHTILQLEANGKIGSAMQRFNIRLSHNDAYLLTAAPVAASMLQYLEGRFNPGLHFQGLLVEPARFIEDIKSFGIEITEELS